MKKLSTAALLVAAPIIGWIFGGFVMLSIVNLLDGFDNNLASLSDDEDDEPFENELIEVDSTEWRNYL